MPVNDLKQKIGQMIGLSKAEEDLAYDIFIDKVSESLEIYNAIKVETLGIFTFARGKDGTGPEVLTFVPSYTGHKDALYYKLDYERSGDDDEFDESIFNPGVKNINIQQKDKSGKNVHSESARRNIEERVVEILSESEPMNEFDLWNDYLNKSAYDVNTEVKVTTDTPQEEASVVDDFDFEELNSSEFFQESNETEEKEDLVEDEPLEEEVLDDAEEQLETPKEEAPDAEAEEEISIHFEFDKPKNKSEEETRFERVESFDDDLTEDDTPEDNEKVEKTESDILSSLDDVEYQDLGNLNSENSRFEAVSPDEMSDDEISFDADPFSELAGFEGVEDEEEVESTENLEQPEEDDEWDVMRKTFDDMDDDKEESSQENEVHEDKQEIDEELEDLPDIEADVWDFGDDEEEDKENEDKEDDNEFSAEDIKDIAEENEFTDSEEDESDKKDDKPFIPPKEKDENDPENDGSEGEFDKKTWDEIYKDFDFDESTSKKIKNDKKEKVEKLEKKRKQGNTPIYKNKLLIILVLLAAVIAVVAYFYFEVNSPKSPITIDDVRNGNKDSSSKEPVDNNSLKPEFKDPDEVNKKLDETINKLEEQKKEEPVLKPVVKQPEVTKPKPVVRQDGYFKDFTGASRVQNLIFKYNNQYYVQVSSVKKESSAEQEAKRFERKGNQVSIWKIYLENKKSYWHRVMVGPFNSVEDARGFL